MKSFKTITATVVASGILFSSCANMNKTQKGAVIGSGSGAVAGAAIGGIIGGKPGSAAWGALIGAAVGGTAGAVIGRRMDKQAQEIEQQVPGAKVERVGEGIVVEFSDAVLFETNKTDLNAAAYRSMDNLITILGKYPDTNIEIDGHTDNKGTAEYNQGLSERRASTVANYLLAKNIASGRITTKGYSFSVPKYTNETVEGRAGNRRVEFQITANEKMKREAQSAQN